MVKTSILDKHPFVNAGNLEILALTFAFLTKKEGKSFKKRSVVEKAANDMRNALEALRICGYNVSPTRLAPAIDTSKVKTAIRLIQSHGLTVIPESLIPAMKKELEKLI